MKNMKKNVRPSVKRTGKKVAFAAMCILSAAVAVGNVVCFGFLGVDFISAALSGTGVKFGDEASLKVGAELVKKISEEGTVLLKNENNTLPLDIENNNKVNVFGYTALDNAWVFTGVGSGSSKPDPEKRVGILKGLENAGFIYNQSIIEAYAEAIPSSDPYMSMNQNGKIMQPESSFYTSEMIEQAKSFSDTAIVVLSRCSGENVGEIPTVQYYYNGSTDTSRSYLDIAVREQEMLDIVTENFEKVIVILNTTNNMQCEFLTDEGVDAALYCGPTGLNGAEGVAHLIAGRKPVYDEDGAVKKDENGLTVYEQVSPSGRLADTYGYDYSSEPAYANYAVRNKTATGGNIVYQEDIYFGYRWYETADAEGVFDGRENGYYDAVLYPFGYGMSYTEFEWTLVSANLRDGAQLRKDSEISVEVSVKNVGDYAGKEVVQLYYTAPYIKGGIEKSAVNLADFAKTATLQPGESQKLTLTLTAYDMASYDCYDKNDNGHTGYELDAGEYVLSLRTDSHNLKEMRTPELHYTIENTINYDTDPTTGYSVINRFTGDDGYAGIAIDGSNVGVNETYLSRADFVGTFKDRQSNLPMNTAKVNAARTYTTHANDVESMPTFGVDSGLSLVLTEEGEKPTEEQLKKREGLKYNDELIDELLKDFDGEIWDRLLNQLTKEEAKRLVECSGFGSHAIASIGKIKTLDYDGPSGFNEDTQKIDEQYSAWVNYPAECVIGCAWSEELANEIGCSVAFEASKSGINGWYAPGVNLHRSNYNGRNYEYYSEDPIISGKLASATILGAKSGGLYCYLKHFALSEEGDNAKGVDTWITEQNFREIYLKPFEIAVKNGANAIMTAFNCIGPVWAGANYDLCTEVLRGEWGFKGSVLTDWASGDSIMNTPRGLVAGNDMWLNPMDRNYAPISVDDSTHMYCAKMAVKNNVCTFISTYQYARDYDPENDTYRVEAGISSASDVSDWWIYAIGAVDAVVLLLTVTLGVKAFAPNKKQSKTKKKKNR